MYSFLVDGVNNLKADITQVDKSIAEETTKAVHCARTILGSSLGGDVFFHSVSKVSEEDPPW